MEHWQGSRKKAQAILNDLHKQELEVTVGTQDTCTSVTHNNTLIAITVIIIVALTEINKHVPININKNVQ